MGGGGRCTAQLGACGGTCLVMIGLGPNGFLAGASNVTIDRSFQLVVFPGESHMFPISGLRVKLSIT